MNLPQTEQQRFDSEYITSSEICETLGVTRPAVHYRWKAGKLPGSIKIQGQQLRIWEREAITPFLEKWKAELDSRSTTQ